MLGVSVLAVVTTLLVVSSGAQLPLIHCGDCDRSSCPEIGSCVGGVVLDVCDCCDVCARRLGQLCENATNAPVYGPCGEYLVCRTRTDTPQAVFPESICECIEQGEVCGSDGKTYRTLCHLLEENVKKPDLSVVKRLPCLNAPEIKTPPMDAKRPMGGIMVLDCEAVGVPVPAISWELYRPDGSSLKLPSDDPAIAVQVRGGPERHMVTGWVQIMKISESNVGMYTCVATNSEGEARATATITYIKDGDEILDNFL